MVTAPVLPAVIRLVLFNIPLVVLALAKVAALLSPRFLADTVLVEEFNALGKLVIVPVPVTAGVFVEVYAVNAVGVDAVLLLLTTPDVFDIVPPLVPVVVPVVEPKARTSELPPPVVGKDAPDPTALVLVFVTEKAPVLFVVPGVELLPIGEFTIVEGAIFTCDVLSTYEPVLDAAVVSKLLVAAADVLTVASETVATV